MKTEKTFPLSFEAKCSWSIKRIDRAVFSSGVLVLLALSPALGSTRPPQGQASVREQKTVLNAPIVLPRLNGPVNLDGFSDEPAWRGVVPLRLTQMEPTYGVEPSERAEILVGYDDRYLYMAGRLYDREPDKITSNSKQRDSDNPACDWFGLVLDSFNDKRNAVAFFTTPAGLRWDSTVFDDAQGKEPINPSWNTFWDVATARNDQGWFAEFRVPFSSLRFQDDSGRVAMGLIVWRSIARKNEWDIFPAIPPDWGFWSKFKPSRAQEVVLEKVYSRKPLYVVPYVLGGLGQNATLNQGRTAYGTARKAQSEAGLDLKYGLSSNLTMDLTVNTDFAQVEADNQQVNLTRFSLFFPEKRLFFLERASIFDFGFEAFEQNRLFYSRTVGLNDGRLVRIYTGARVVGRMGGWDLGFLEMQTAAEGGRPSENFGVMRFRRQVFNPYSYAGGIVTSRLGADGRFNLAYGLDGTIRLFGDDYLDVKWAQTFTNGKPNMFYSLDPAKVYIKWMRDNNKGPSYAFVYSRSGRDFDPQMGFESRHDYTRVYGGLYYGWFPGETSPLLSHKLSLESLVYQRNGDGAVESLTFGPTWAFATKSGFTGSISPQLVHERVSEKFSLSSRTFVPAGCYRFFNMAAELQTPQGNSVFAIFDAILGRFYDGRRVTLSVMPVWSVSSSLGLDAVYQFNRVVFPARGQEFTAHVFRLRALYMFDTKLSAAAFVQFNSAANLVAGNFRVRYNPREGVDFYLVYNENLNSSRNREFPALPLSSARTILLKWSYTFSF
jgi:hypothetical protein